MAKLASTSMNKVLSEGEFQLLCKEYLKPAQAIQQAEHLKGRTKALDKVKEALRSPGKHAFVYGSRGVGKTSLAQTAAYLLNGSSASPTIVNCQSDSSFASLCKDIAQRLAKLDPLEKKGSKELKLAANAFGIGGEIGFASSVSTSPPSITTINEAVLLFEGISKRVGHELIVVIDEFDLIADADQRSLFAGLIKALSDQRVDLKIIFCGIFESIDNLFAAHASTYRYIHAEKLERLGAGACLEIIDDAARAFGFYVDSNVRYRIAQISDGFPYYVHLLCEKAFLITFRNSKNKITGSYFNEALNEASESIEPHLKKPYEDSVHKYTKDSEPILWAVADHRLLEVPRRDILSSYSRITTDARISELKKENVQQRLGKLCSNKSGQILSQPRRSYYTFTEPMMRGYARLRAAQSGIEVGPENASG